MSIRRATTTLALAGAVLLGLASGVGSASGAPAEGAGCESTDSLAVNYLPDDAVQIVRNTCHLPVRSISYSRYTTNVPLTGFPSEPGKYNRWNCGGAATGSAEVSDTERSSNWLITYAKGWQIRRSDGRWHTIDAVPTVSDRSFVQGKPFATDACALDPQDQNWDDDFDDGFVLD